MENGNTSTDEKWMKRAIEIAKLGSPKALPNPLVGCVIVKNNRIIGEGYHAKYGEGHAEVNAVNQVKEPAELDGATVYVTLEPCSHYGKTPPCCEMLSSLKVKRVVIGSLDPNPIVGGKGAQHLKNKGISITSGILEENCKSLNRFFYKSVGSPLPYITLKWAATQDGFVDRMRTNSSQSPLSITDEVASTEVHLLRAKHNGICVGANTYLLDRPKLTTRLIDGADPTPIIWDPSKRCNEALSKVSASVFLLTGEHDPALPENIVQLTIKKDKDQIYNALQTLRETYNVQRILVEGGPKLQQLFIAKGIWDEAYQFINNDILIEGVSAPVIPCEPSTQFQLGNCACNIYYNN